MTARLAALFAELADASEHRARLERALAAELAGTSEEDAPVPSPPLPPARVKQRRGPRLPRGVIVTEEDRERVRRAGGIFGE